MRLVVDQLPNLGREQELLDAIGLATIDDLFSDIPESVRRTEPLDLPGPQSEEEIWADAQMLLSKNVPLTSRPSFIGAGLYQNHVPTMVPMLATRGEFLTAYTPYQPEVSQGMLQAMWEFQSMVSELVALPVANVSMYDASTAAAEAITCAVRVHSRKAARPDVIYVPEWTPVDRMSVIQNYIQGAGIELRFLSGNDGIIDLGAAEEAAGCAAVYVEQPNPFGIIDPGLFELKVILGEDTALIVGVNPSSLGVVAPPGDWGADIVVGEGQCFGIGPTGGGPIYGLFACRDPYLRQMPGRIVGLAKDESGQRAFTLTLSTREQHIRRHKATSNICSNETLIALMGAMHMALLGPEGLERMAVRNVAACARTKEAVLAIDGMELLHPDAAHYNEFTVVLPGPAADALSFLDAGGVTGGLALRDIMGERTDESWLLITATDQTTESDITALADGLAAWCAEVNG